MRHLTVTSVWFMGLCLLASPVRAQEAGSTGPSDDPGQAAVTYGIEGRTLLVNPGADPTGEVPLPCAGEAVTWTDTHLYVACGQAGLLVLDRRNAMDPAVIGIRDLGGAVVGFFSAQGRIWAEISRIEARPVEVGALSPTAVQAQPGPATIPEWAPAETMPAPTTAASPTPIGEVVEVRAGEVVIDLGTDDGIERRDHIELYQREMVDIGGGEQAVNERRLAVGEARALTESRAQVALGMNERVPSDTLARPTSLELTSNNWLPPRVGGLWEVGFMARPFLALGTMGAGMLSHVDLAYRFEKPVVIEAILDPLGIGFAEEGNVVALAGNVFAAYDTPAFEVGLGLGWTVVNDQLGGGTMASEDRGSNGIGTEFDEVSHGLSIAQIARLGARDGLHLLVTNNFVLNEGEFKYGGTSGTIQVPLPTGNTRTWFITRGGGGTAGYAFGEIGLRVLLRGNGDTGSLFVTPSIGGAYIQGQKEIECDVWDPQTNGTVPGTCIETIGYGGPMVGFGMEWRF